MDADAHTATRQLLGHDHDFGMSIIATPSAIMLTSMSGSTEL
jgi:hypothetical protein